MASFPRGVGPGGPCKRAGLRKTGLLELGVAPEQAPDTPAYITIHFEKGKPTALDGKAMKASTLLKELNAVGGANGIGIIDIVENRLVGMKSRVCTRRRAAPSCILPTSSWKCCVWTRRPLTIRRWWRRNLPISFTTASGTRPCARRCPPLWTKRRRM